MHQRAPQGEVTNVNFLEDIKIISQEVTKDVGKQSGAGQEEADTLRIREFMRMNPPRFTSLSTTRDAKNILEELKFFSYGECH